MKTTTLESFRRELLTTGAYHTSAECLPTRRAKPSGLVTWRYSWAVARPFRLCGLYEGLGRLTTEKLAEFCFSTVSCAESLGIQVHFEGWQNRQAYKGPVMYLCNHMSMTETVLLPPVVLTYGPFNIVAKQSLAHLPFLERAAAHMGLVGIGRKSPREDLMKILTVGEERMRAGNSFLIFPQGTRQAVFSRAKFSSIGAKLAERAQCPICPIVVDTRCQPTRQGNGALAKALKDFGPIDTSKDIRCCCGPLIMPDKAKVMHEATFDWMAGQLERWGLPIAR